MRFDEIRRHYYCTHPPINPSGLVALRPLEDFDAPHGREVVADWRCNPFFDTVYDPAGAISRLPGAWSRGWV